MSIRYSTENIDQFLQSVERIENDAEGTGISSLRQRAFDRFAKLGIPTTRHEEWKYTNLAPITRTEFHPVPALTTEDLAERFGDVGFRGDADRLVFVNGLFVDELSSIGTLPEGVVVMSLARAISEETEQVVASIASQSGDSDHPFVNLNTAHLRDGAFVHVARNASHDRPIHLLYINDSSSESVACYPRTLVVAEEGAVVTVIEEFVSNEGETGLTNGVAEFTVGDNARVDHIRVQAESREGYHLYSSFATLGRDSRYYNNALSFGGRIARNDPSAVLAGEGGHASLDGLYVAGGDQLIDSHTSIDHTVANCTSHEIYKGVLDNNSRGVFNGKIFVRQDAQKTDSVQSNMNLLLSDDAEIDTKPQLEIFADDVKCTHGATIGRLDDRSIFYLQSRGIGHADAVKMLTYAFAAEVIDHIANEEIRDYAESLLGTRIEH